jgi:non-ribosomal peptide synthetase component F
VWFTLDPGQWQDIATACRAARVTPFALLLTVFLAVLAEAADRDDVGVGTILANRPRREVFQTVGFFANLVLLRQRQARDRPWAQLVRQTARTVLEALDHQELPYMSIPLADRPRGAARPESTVFHMLASPPATPGTDGSFAGLESIPVRIPEGTGARFDLELLIFPDGDAADGVFRYAADQYTREYVTDLVRHYRAMLAKAVADLA